MKYTACILLLLALNLVCFAAYALDKTRARKGLRRMPERHLHLLTALLASPGAWAAMVLLHHKIRKPAFYRITLLMTAAQIASLLFYLKSTGCF